MNPEIAIAVMSDLHCHPIAESPRASFLNSDALPVPIFHHPVEALQDLIEKQQIKADLLLTPGDLTNKCSLDGILSAWRFVEQIGHAIGARNLIAAVGNHDVDSRNQHGHNDPFKFAKGLPRYPSKSSSLSSDYWGKGYFIFEEDDLRVVVLNSIAQHNNLDDATRGKIEQSNLETLERELQVLPSIRFQIACVHHHPIQHEERGLGSSDLMVNGDNLIQVLNRYGYKLVIHGHKHHARLTYAQGGTYSPTVFAAGSLSATDTWGITTFTRNLFHVVYLDSISLSGCTLCGQIKSWEYSHGIGWLEATKQSAGFPALAGVGCRVPIDQLVDRTRDWFEDQSATMPPWTEVIKTIPELDFLIPADRIAYEKMMDEKYSIKIWNQSPGVTYLVKVSG